MHCLNLLLAGVIAAAPAPAIHGQTSNWQIDSAHSTARFTLTSSNGKGRSYELAIAMVAGKLDVDASKPADALMSLNIYPAGQDSNLLTQDGAFRSGSLANLTNYTLLTFQSKRSFVGPDGKLMIVGDLTAVHVQRRADMMWSIAYAGPVNGDPVVNRIVGEVTCVLEMPASTIAKEQNKSPAEGSASCAIERSKFPGLWPTLRDSEWPIVVLDEVCEMPYYLGPGLKHYKGATCTGTPVTVAPYDDESLAPPAVEGIGSAVPVPPTGDQVLIHVHLQLTR